MPTGSIPSLALGFALTGFAEFGWSAPRVLSERNPGITIHIDNYADVDRKTLIEAERIAAGIFRKAGVETRWVDFGPATSGTPGNPPDPRPFMQSDIQLGILPRRMADRLALPDGVLGVAPGAETGRHLAYVFYDRVESLAARQVSRRAHENICEGASTSQILGHAMAHEIGHLLLNLETHSDAGIMRANWDDRTLQDACYGYLLFTREQAGEIRAEAQRRLAEPGPASEPQVGTADRMMVDLK